MQKPRLVYHVGSNINVNGYIHAKFLFFYIFSLQKISLILRFEGDTANIIRFNQINFD